MGFCRRLKEERGCFVVGLLRIRRAVFKRRADCMGQASVEAAFLIPVLFVLMLLLMQPGIVLYDRMVMNAAATEACRLLATKTESAGDMNDSCKSFVLHRLGAIPPVSCFHVHDEGCTWDVRFEGDESSDVVRTTISTELRPLPLIGLGASLAGIVNDKGNFVVEVTAEQTTQPLWVGDSSGGFEPKGWIGAWLS